MNEQPLLGLGWGLVLVGVDLRIGGFDLLMDVIGWWLIYLSVVRLGHRPARLGGQPWIYLVAMLLSFADLVRPVPVVWIYDVAVVVAGVLLAHWLASRAAADGDQQAASRWRLLRTAQLVLGLVIAFSTVGIRGLGGPIRVSPGFDLIGFDWRGLAATSVPAVIAGFADLGVLVVMVVTLFRHSTRSWARPRSQLPR